MKWSTDRWIGVGGIVLTVIALLPAIEPFRTQINIFNDWYAAKDRERLKRRLAYSRDQLVDIINGTSHLHFQKSISGGLLALTLAIGIVLLSFFVPPERRDSSSVVALALSAFGAAIWQFASAYRRLNGIREKELRDRIQKLEKRLHEAKL